MDVKPFPAFGYVLMKAKLKAGEIVSDDMMDKNFFYIDNPTPDSTGSISGSKGAYVWVMLNGIQTYTNLDTGDVDKHEHGWCNLVNPLTAGRFKFDSVTDSEHICFSPRANAHRTPSIPELEFFELGAGQERTIPTGTRLYLVDGELAINGKTIPAMRQVRFGTGATHVKANAQCYGLVFKGD
jgi:hypothetical protein